MPKMHIWENISSTVESLAKASNLFYQWFIDNHMVANEQKYHVLLSTDKNVLVNIGTAQILNSSSEKPLGVKIDGELNFKGHEVSFCYNNWILL